MLHPALEFPYIETPIGASLHSDAMALPTDPLAGVAIAAVEPIHPEAVPQALPVLPPVPAPPRPALDPITIILAINPIALVSPLGEEIVDAAPVAAPLVELALVEIPVAVELHPLPHDLPVALFLPRFPVAVADEPLDRLPPPDPAAAEDEEAGLAGREEGDGEDKGRKEEVAEEGGVIAEVEEEEEQEEEEGKGQEGRKEWAAGPAASATAGLLIVGVFAVCSGYGGLVDGG